MRGCRLRRSASTPAWLNCSITRCRTPSSVMLPSISLACGSAYRICAHRWTTDGLILIRLFREANTKVSALRAGKGLMDGLFGVGWLVLFVFGLCFCVLLWLCL